MFSKRCPCCRRLLRAATVSSLGLFAFHEVYEAREPVHASASRQDVRQEHAPEKEPPAGRDIPGLYPVASLTTTTTTTTSPPSPTIAVSPLVPAPGNVVAWSDTAQAWVEIPDCGFQG